MKRTLTMVLITLAVLSVLFTGCSNEKYEAEKRAVDDINDIWGYEEQAVRADTQQIHDSTSESHRMMAIMILNGAGRDTNLESYDAVYLVDLKTEDDKYEGRVVVVVKDDKKETIIPQTIKDGQ